MSYDCPRYACVSGLGKGSSLGLGLCSCSKHKRLDAGEIIVVRKSCYQSYRSSCKQRRDPYESQWAKECTALSQECYCKTQHAHAFDAKAA